MDNVKSAAQFSLIHQHLMCIIGLMTELEAMNETKICRLCAILATKKQIGSAREFMKKIGLSDCTMQKCEASQKVLMANCGK